MGEVAPLPSFGSGRRVAHRPDELGSEVRRVGRIPLVAHEAHTQQAPEDQAAVGQPLELTRVGEAVPVLVEAGEDAAREPSPLQIDDVFVRCASVTCTGRYNW